MGTCCNKNERNCHTDRKEENLTAQISGQLSERATRPRELNDDDKAFFARAKTLQSNRDDINVFL